eukprot:jgi/Chrzof1/7705/Cz02g33180.t1
MGLCLPFRDDGVGLAAPQVGVNIRLMVFNQTAKPGDPAETILVNPEIIAKSKTTWRDEEGCLSFPNIFADIERYEKVEVRYQTAEGELREMALSGWEGKIFQHEFDHLQGVLFPDRMSPADVQRVRPQLEQLETTYQTAHPETALPERIMPPVAKAVGFGKR